MDNEEEGNQAGYCGSDGEWSEDSNLERRLQAIAKKKTSGPLPKRLPSNSSNTSSDESSAQALPFPVKKPRIDKPDSEDGADGPVAKGGVATSNPVMATLLPEDSNEVRKKSGTKEAEGQDCQEDSDFEDLASFWNNIDDDFFANSNVEGIVIDESPISERVVAAGLAPASEEFANTEKEAPTTNSSPAPNPTKENQSRKCIKNPYKTAGTTSTLKAETTVEQTRKTDSAKCKVNATLSDAKSKDTGDIPVVESASRAPCQAAVSSQLDQDDGVQEPGDDWLEQLLEEELAQVEKEIGSLPQENATLENPPSPQEWDEDTMARAFGFDERTATSSESRIHPGQPPMNQEASEKTETPPGIDVGDRRPEVHPELYAPSTPPPPHDPMVHHFTEANSPSSQRQRLPVRQVFDFASIASFFKYECFNHLQSAVANTCAFSDDNVVLSAPTGAGKTAVFEMAMARFFTIDMQRNNGTVTMQRKLMYVAPNKALCEQRLADWSSRLTPLKIQVAAITGDGDPSEAFRDVATAHVIITTPEKWDSLTRKWTENFYLFASVKLVLLDEIHLIADPTRGACLEALVCRLKAIQRAAQNIDTDLTTIQTSSYSNTTPEAINSVMRTVAVSATLPNIADIASFLGAHEAHVFDESYRPVPLTVHVLGLGFVKNDGKDQFHFWQRLDREVANIIHKFSSNRPTIVFCQSKAETEKLASLLATNGLSQRKNNHEIASKTRLQKLQKALLAGIAYHHAGLELDDRRLVEQSFAASKISILCATSTLAMGVNLPAHLVVIKGTKAWRGSSGYQDLDQATLLQMIGRAGRPGFDTSGTAVIMTDNQSKPKFQKLAASGLEPAMSQLRSKFDEVANTELSQKVITGISTFVNWTMGTLFYIQLSRTVGTSSREEAAFQLCDESLRRLEHIKAIRTESQGALVEPLQAGHIMSQNMVEYDTMRILTSLPFDASQVQVLKAIAQIEGLHRPVRRSEKKQLKEAHKSLKYKLDGPISKVTVQEPWEKSFVLLQASLCHVHFDEYALRQEMTAMTDYASRMLLALEEYSARASLCGQVAAQALKLRRALATGLWNSENGVLGQFRSLDTATVAALRFSGIGRFEDVVSSSEEHLEKVAKRMPPFGKNLRRAVQQTLSGALTVSAEIEYAASSTTPSELVCRVEHRDKENPTAVTNGDSKVEYTLIVYTNQPGGCLIYRQKLKRSSEHRVVVPGKFGKIFVRLISSMVGLDVNAEIQGNMPEANEPTRSSGGTPRGTPRKVRGYRSNILETSLNRCKNQVPENVPDRRIAVNPKGKEHAIAKDRRTQVATTVQRSVSTTQNFAPLVDREMARNRTREVTPSSKLALSPAPTKATPYNPMAERTSTVVGPGPVGATRYPSALIHTPPPTNNVLSQLERPPENDVLLYAHCSVRTGGVSRPRENQPPRPTTAKTSTTLSTRSHCNQGTSQPWSLAKRDQSRRQQRAFSQKGDNPFAVYNHDPNDAETTLDSLSSRLSQKRDSESIIPADRLRQLDTVYKNMESTGSRQRSSDGPIARRHARRFPAARQVLMQKATEHNQYANNAWPGHSDVVNHSPYLYGQQPTRVAVPHYQQRQTMSPYAEISLSHNTAVEGQHIYHAETAIVPPNNPYQYDTSIRWGGHTALGHVPVAHGYEQSFRTDVCPPHLVEEQAYYIPQVGHPTPSIGPYAARSPLPDAWDTASYPQHMTTQRNASTKIHHESPTQYQQDAFQGLDQTAEGFGEWETAFFL
ncbi:hypothetical protein ACA910_007219 [Epithemia clementina (nom. ined.)]